MAQQASWLTPSSPRTGASTLMTANTGSWAPRATAGRKVMAWPPPGPSVLRWPQWEGSGDGGCDSGSSRQEGGGWEAIGLGSGALSTPPPPAPTPCCWSRSWSYIPGDRAHCLCWPGTFLSSRGCAEGGSVAALQQMWPRQARLAGRVGRAGPGFEGLTCGTRRSLAHRPGARGGPRDWPCAGPDALAAWPGAHAPQRHSAWLEDAVAGRALGAAPTLR